MPTAKAIVKKTAKTTVRKPAKKVTIDDVWATIDEIGKAHKELEKAHRETEKSLNEVNLSHKETKKSLNEINLSHKETERTLNEVRLIQKETVKTLNKAIGGLSNTLGSLVEHIMTPGLPGKFKQFGFAFDKITTVKWAVEGSLYAEIDGLLENGNQAMVVEVKTTLRHADIDDHLERMEKVRKYADDRGDKREFLGAMAAMITDKDTKEYALSKGFFVIEPSGEDVKVTKPVSEKIW